MKIANPIYDVAFKYLMEDNEIAKDYVSAILGIDIVSIEIQAQEFVEINKETGLRMYRIDFKAIIRDKNGKLQTSLIEIQKSKKGLEVERFQSYLGLNYLKQNIVLDANNVSKKVGYPITPIYILGFRLKNIKVPVLKVERTYTNAISGRKLKVKEDFVEKLSHDLYAIQIPRLKMQARTDLEKMLDVFNSSKYKTSDSRIFNYTGDTSDPRIARVVKHLGRAIIDDDNLLHAMLVEDEIEELMARIKRDKEAMAKKGEETDKKLEEVAKIKKESATIIKEAAMIKKENELAIAEKKKAVAEKESAVAEKESAMAEKESAMAEKESAMAEKESAMAEKGKILAEQEVLKNKIEALEKQLQDKNKSE